MTPTVIMLFFFATAPIGLMPSIIALLTRHRSRMLIVVANLALWSVIFLVARSFTIDTSSRFQWPTLLALAGWMVLLGHAIRGPTLPRNAGGR